MSFRQGKVWSQHQLPQHCCVAEDHLPWRLSTHVQSKLIRKHKSLLNVQAHAISVSLESRNTALSTNYHSNSVRSRTASCLVTSPAWRNKAQTSVGGVGLLLCSKAKDALCDLKSYSLHCTKSWIYWCLPMWQIYSKFKFAPIAKVVNATFAHRMSKCGIWHLCYRCKFEFALYLPHWQPSVNPTFRAVLRVLRAIFCGNHATTAIVSYSPTNVADENVVEDFNDTLRAAIYDTPAQTSFVLSGTSMHV